MSLSYFCERPGFQCVAFHLLSFLTSALFGQLAATHHQSHHVSRSMRKFLPTFWASLLSFELSFFDCNCCCKTSQIMNSGRNTFWATRIIRLLLPRSSRKRQPSNVLISYSYSHHSAFQNCICVSVIVVHCHACVCVWSLWCVSST